MTLSLFTFILFIGLALLSVGHGLKIKAASASHAVPGNTVTTSDITVTNTNDSGPGSLSQAIDDAFPGTTIRIPLMGVPATIKVAPMAIDFGKDIIIKGPGSDQLTIDGNNASRIFDVASNVTISGLTFAKGKVTSGGGSPAQGGAINIRSTGMLNLMDVKFTNNVALGVSKTSGFGDNAYGGAVHNAGMLFATGCAFDNNKVSGSDINGAPGTTGIGGDGYAADIYNDHGTVQIMNTTFSNSTAAGGKLFGGVFGTNGTGFGGSVVNNGGTVSLTGCTLFSNSADFGGAIYTDGVNSVFNATNCTIYSNTATVSGGGIALTGGSLNSISNTIVANKATNRGGGIYSQCASSTPCGAISQNTIVANNVVGPTGSGPEISGSMTSGGYNLIKITTGASITPAQLNDIFSVDPLLGPPTNNGGPTLTLFPQLGSPAIDQGNSFGLTTDQRGEPRPKDLLNDPTAPGDRSDIGACEVQPPVAQCQPLVTVPADASCAATITAAQVNNGSLGDSISLALNFYGPFAPGLRTVTLNVTDSYGASSSCDSALKVINTTPPTFTLKPSIILWPPDHTYQTIYPRSCVATFSDACNPSFGLDDLRIVRVESDEVSGDGVPDIITGTDCKSVQLRATRNGTGDGRGYTVYFVLPDTSLNKTPVACTVRVPHSQDGIPAVQGPPAQTVYCGQ
jgi:hypothetical protein